MKDAFEYHLTIRDENLLAFAERLVAPGRIRRIRASKRNSMLPQGSPMDRKTEGSWLMVLVRGFYGARRFHVRIYGREEVVEAVAPWDLATPYYSRPFHRKEDELLEVRVPAEMIELPQWPRIEIGPFEAAAVSFSDFGVSSITVSARGNQSFSWKPARLSEGLTTMAVMHRFGGLHEVTGPLDDRPRYVFRNPREQRIFDMVCKLMAGNP
ncbi:MAG: hypothetical protein N2036_05310 [Bryobacteraceae bacterium]|nr:hypothetical protein [Bryobacteraceae bacterium]